MRRAMKKNKLEWRHRVSMVLSLIVLREVLSGECDLARGLNQAEKQIMAVFRWWGEGRRRSLYACREGKPAWGV